ncbi:hypothetical protein LJ655_10980 [Paraburkholderia sp. MMS20-SJTN17]|uniref:CHAT domain-containing protein n=1 Tax=Paraburkholderia translucens TaxID=2886945 RepID=A0ABS8KCB5_9BURK|nr:hypothetical protein [Paraburkholderia sp. MMS20-SJTN17]MCC8402410.1 hypothetical protein [Paraburkholderia sp. MMS20-SJTN17]
MQLFLDANGDSIKLVWRSDEGGRRSKPILLPKAFLLDRARKIRDELNNLNDYVQTTQLDESKDPGWVRYREILNRLTECGRWLSNAIFNFRDEHAQELLEALDALPHGAEVKIFCSDDQVTLPLGFVYANGAPVSEPTDAPATEAKRPSREDFAGFWLNRFKITMAIDGGPCGALVIDPASFKSLYALHKSELANAAAYLGDDRAHLDLLLTTIDFRKGYYDWPNAQRACGEAAGWDGVVFVFAHSNGDMLELDSTRIDSLQFAEMLHRNRDDAHTALIVLNCCLSATGGENCSLLGAVAERGFCGLIGTEAEILNTHAIRCGTRIMWGLCAEGLSLGDAFDHMQNDTDLFPLNLFYTCYADRRFRLATPFTHLKAA